MLSKLKSFPKLLWDIVSNPLSWKFAVVVTGFALGLVNLAVPPKEFVTLPKYASPYLAYSIQAGGFALITTIVLFAGLIPTGKMVMDNDASVEFLARLLGVGASFGAGWFSLESATQGETGTYIFGIFLLTGLAVMALLVWAGFALIFRLIWNVLEAASRWAAGRWVGNRIMWLSGKLKRDS